MMQSKNATSGITIITPHPDKQEDLKTFGDEKYMLEVLISLPGSRSSTHIGYMNALFNYKEEASDYYDKYNTEGKPLHDAEQRCYTSGLRKDHLRYVVREHFNETLTIPPFNPADASTEVNGQLVYPTLLPKSAYLPKEGQFGRAVEMTVCSDPFYTLISTTCEYCNSTHCIDITSKCIPIIGECIVPVKDLNLDIKCYGKPYDLQKYIRRTVGEDCKALICNYEGKRITADSPNTQLWFNSISSTDSNVIKTTFKHPL